MKIRLQQKLQYDQAIAPVDALDCSNACAGITPGAPAYSSIVAICCPSTAGLHVAKGGTVGCINLAVVFFTYRLPSSNSRVQLLLINLQTQGLSSAQADIAANASP